MSDLFGLTDAQMGRLQPFFPKSHCKLRVDGRRVLSGIIFINRNGLRWRDAPAAYGPHKTLYSRWKRLSDKGIFAQMMVGLCAEHGEEKTVMIRSHRNCVSTAGQWMRRNLRPTGQRPAWAWKKGGVVACSLPGSRFAQQSDEGEVARRAA